MDKNLNIEFSETNRGKEQDVLNTDQKINYEDLHNHLEKECNASISLTKHRIKEEIRKCSTPFYIRPRGIFNEFLKKWAFCYKTERNENFMIFKNSNIIIFQSPFQEKLYMQYNIDIFSDGTFKIATKWGYQVFITRTYVMKLNSFYTTSFSILKNKEQRTYENNNIIIPPKNFHCDFEKGISNAA
ncbi:hypothetical protein H8356DRAFT_1389663 [Neocallimastix lanati (nom. inval.)]|nr:hypothetical protein H8356DRAFT_1389663 [Neocallimastix sp. JGI-2020a]